MTIVQPQNRQARDAHHVIIQEWALADKETDEQETCSLAQRPESHLRVSNLQALVISVRCLPYENR